MISYDKVVQDNNRFLNQNGLWPEYNDTGGESLYETLVIGNDTNNVPITGNGLNGLQLQGGTGGVSITSSGNWLASSPSGFAFGDGASHNFLEIGTVETAEYVYLGAIGSGNFTKFIINDPTKEMFLTGGAGFKVGIGAESADSDYMVTIFGNLLLQGSAISAGATSKWKLGGNIGNVAVTQNSTIQVTIDGQTFNIAAESV